MLYTACRKSFPAVLVPACCWKFRLLKERGLLSQKIKKGMRRVGTGLLLLLLAAVAWQAWQYMGDARYQGMRSPYLQMQSPDGITIRWQSADAVRGVVRYGMKAENLDMRLEESVAKEEHEIRITGLKPDTRYWYAVGSEGQVSFGGGINDWFMTAPKPGSGRPVRIWVQGDPGRALPTTLAGRDAVLAWIRAHLRPGLPALDLWFTTGDNAYRYGRNSEFQQHLFDAYPTLLRNVPYWPVYGNHDARRWAFYNIFSFPENAEAGGVPSGDEHFFSFDYGQVHFIFLDSHSSDRTRDGDMLHWLKRDLAATRQPWLIALFHHAPYSKGSHDSDDPGDSKGRMIEMRENALPILEAAGVDLVLSGHSHVYERSFLLDCHYGSSGSLKPSMFVDKGMGMETPYRKPAGLTPHSGTVYNVVGSSAYADNGPLDHPVMAVAKQELGSLLLDIDGNTLEGRFITPKGEVLDHYRIVKEGEAGIPRRCE